MTFTIVTEPIERWPLPETRPRTPIRFKAGYADTLELLKRELAHLGATGTAVIQVVTRNGAADVRRDGALMARAKIEHPGVRLSFTSRHGPLTYATDQFAGDRYYGNMPDWQANLRAIALGLEALRAVDRYGISRSGEQYRGWRAIEGGAGDAPLTGEQAWQLVARLARADVDECKLFPHQTVRLARANAHPDRNGGDRRTWDELERALKVLGLLDGGS